MVDRPFRLFDAPLSDCYEYLGGGRCDLCGKQAAHVFTLGVGSDTFQACPHCNEPAHIDSRPPVALRCHRCGTGIPARLLPEEPVCCAECLRLGLAAVTKDTELGMVRWEDARDGWTHGLPVSRLAGWELSEPNADGWSRVRVPSDLLLEHVRTPAYGTIQGDHWLFCCKAPMIFVGTWSRERFSSEAMDGNGSALLDLYLGRHIPGLWEDELHDQTGIYVFRCNACGKRRAHWDIG